MAMPDDDVITIDVSEEELAGVLDAGNQDRPAPKKAGGGADIDDASAGIDSLRDQVSALTKERDDERRRAEEAQRREREAERRARTNIENARREVDSAKTESIDAQRTAIDNAMVAAKSAADSAEAEYAAAFERGDAKAAAAAQRKMAQAESQLVQLEAGKSALEQAPAAKPARAEGNDDRAPRGAEAAPANADPVEAYIRQFSPESQKWLRAHPECVTNRAKNLLVMVADEEAVENGLKRDTPEYFTYIDRRMGYARDDRRETERKQNHEGNGSMAASKASAPVRGSASGAPAGGRSTSVELTQGEVKQATDGTIVWNTGPHRGEPIGLKEMARRKAVLQKEGRYETPYA
jgi:hypothetical protein